MIKDVGVIGLGKMGQPIVRHLVAKGFAVTGCDVRAEAVAAAERRGARAAASPRAVAEASDLVIVLVGFENEVMTVLQGADGVLAGARRGAVIAIASTVKPLAMPKIVALVEAARRDLVVLDTPVCRGEPAAEAGQLLLLAGGDAAAFERCRPAFSSFADALYLLGESGAGQVGKMINNMILWACVCGNYEGLKLARMLGADVDLLVEALTKSSANNYALETWHDPRPMPWAEKDMAIVMEEAEMARLPLPLSGVIREVVKQIKNEKGAPVPVARK